MKTCTLVGWWREGYIQKFPSTVLVPPQLYISSMHPTAHTHVQNIAYPFPKVFLSYLNLNESLKWPNIPIQWQTPPRIPTLHMHNYNTIQNFVDLKIGLNLYQAINDLITDVYIETSLLSHRDKLHHWHSSFSIFRLALTSVDILLSKKHNYGCYSDCAGRLICAFVGRNWH